MADGNKECTVCGTVKPRSDFEGNRRVCKDCKKKQVRKLANSNPKQFLGKRLRDTRSRCRQRNVKFKLTLAELLEIYDKQNGQCALTGFPLHHTDSYPDFAISIDRLDPPLGYTKDNVRLVCVRANLMRNELTDEQFVWWAKALVNHDEN